MFRKSILFLSSILVCAADVDKTINTILTPVAITTNALMQASDQLNIEDAKLRATEFFDLRLPTNIGESELHFTFEPKFGDFVHRSYVRFPIQVQYTPIANLTNTLGITPFIPGPSDFHVGNWGLGFISEELRYDLHPKYLYFQDFVIGTAINTPIGRAPVELINGFTHIHPYAVASKELCLPHTKLLIQVDYDLPAHWYHRADEQYKYNLLQYGPALFYKPNEFGYLAQVALKHYHTQNGDFIGTLERIGLQWDIPERRTKLWGLRGKWQIDTAVQSETNEHHRISDGLNTQVRWKFDLRK